MNQDIFEKVKKIHFIGIGGIGVSALARMMLFKKKKITGSDILTGPALERIQKLGAKVFIGHKKTNLIKDTDAVIYSPAIEENNPELIQAKKLNIPVYSYPQALGLISKNKYTIAVSGTHGKTTTTAMLAEVMILAEKSPTIIIGGFLKKQKDNFVFGKSEYFVVEACEYKESFLNLSPNILIITNIDNDHLDYFKNIKNIQNAFAKLINKVPQNGFIICDPKEQNTKQALKLAEIKAKVIDYTKEKRLKLEIPGEYNIKNAQAILAIAKLVNIKEQKAQELLKKYTGTWRRFEYKGTWRGALIYDDYAHHPTEIKAVLKAMRQKFFNKKIIVVFQPHLYSRTKLLLNDFAKSFNYADNVIIADIYAAREKKDKSIHAKDLVKMIKTKRPCLETYNLCKGCMFQDTVSDYVQYIPNFKDIIKYLKKNINKNNIIMIIGAGDIYKIGEKLIVK